MSSQLGKMLTLLYFLVILSSVLFILYTFLFVLVQIQNIKYVYDSISQRQKNFSIIYQEIFVCLETNNEEDNSRMLSVVSRQLLSTSSLGRLSNLEWHIRLLLWSKLLLWYFDERSITTLYVHYMPFEGGYGIEYSAKFYFNKEFTDLSVDEIITLIAIARSPQNYSSPKQQSAKLDQLKVKLYEKLVSCHHKPNA